MGLEAPDNISPVSAYCNDLRYQAVEPGDSKNHDLDWHMRVKIDARNPLEKMTAKEITKHVHTKVEEAAAFSIWGSAPGLFTASPDETEAKTRVHFDINKMDAVRQTQWETEHNPFLAEFNFDGKLSVDTRIVISDHEAWQAAKRQMAFDIANRVTETILESVEYRGKDCE